MSATPLDSKQANLLETVGHCLRTSGMHVYATMDGSFHDNLEKKLKSAKLLYRPLYRSTTHPGIVLGGPFIVNAHQTPQSSDLIAERMASKSYEGLSPQQVSQRLAKEMNDAIKAGDPTGGGLLPVDDYQDIEAALQRVETMIRIVGETSGLVFWFGDKRLTWESFYQHLRRLNKFQVHRQHIAGVTHAIADAAGAAEPVNEPEKYESLVFRHADANVLSQILPVLEPDKLDRFMGPAHTIFYLPTGMWGESAMTLRRSAYTEKPHRGPLYLSSLDMSKITEIRCAAYDLKFVNLLKTECEKRGYFIYTSELKKKVKIFRVHATESYGLVSEKHVYEFIAIAVLYEQQARNDAWLDHTLRRPDLNNNEKMRMARERYPINQPEG